MIANDKFRIRTSSKLNEVSQFSSFDNLKNTLTLHLRNMEDGTYFKIKMSVKEARAIANDFLSLTDGKP